MDTDYRALTDAQLLAASRRDPEAFVALYDRYARSAVTWVRRGAIPEADVLDTVAELFAQAWRSRRRFRDPGDGDAGGWLHGIARNLVRHYHRRGSNESAARRRLGLEPPAVPREEDSDRRLDAASAGAHLQAALEALPDGQRAAVRLRVVDGLDYAEIAARLSCTPTTARKRVSLGLRNLRINLDPELT